MTIAISGCGALYKICFIKKTSAELATMKSREMTNDYLTHFNASGQEMLHEMSLHAVRLFDTFECMKIH